MAVVEVLLWSWLLACSEHSAPVCGRYAAVFLGSNTRWISLQQVGRREGADSENSLEKYCA